MYIYMKLQYFSQYFKNFCLLQKSVGGGGNLDQSLGKRREFKSSLPLYSFPMLNHIFHPTQKLLFSQEEENYGHNFCAMHFPLHG